MLVYKKRAGGPARRHTAAVVVLHEIYGVNAHMEAVCRQYAAKGCDVYLPDLIQKKGGFAYAQEKAAYQNFMQNGGFDAYRRVNGFLQELRPFYRTVLLVGYSVGATLAWNCSESGLCDGVIGFYGPRIRDCLSVVPKCPVLLFFAEGDAHCDARQMRVRLTQNARVTVRVMPGGHGFCDPFSGRYRPASAQQAQRQAEAFCRRIALPE